MPPAFRPLGFLAATFLVAWGGTYAAPAANVSAAVPSSPAASTAISRTIPLPTLAAGARTDNRGAGTSSEETAAGESETEVPAERVIPLDPSNPYRPIVARNAFRLKDPLPPPPPPTNAAPPPEAPKVDVKLSGFGIINGVRYAYLVVPDGGKQGQFSYPSLTDDPRRGDTRYEGVEVKEIDLKNKTVRIVNGGLEVALNFKDNGIKSAAAPAAPAKPGLPAPGGGGGNTPRPPTTVVVPAANNPPMPASAQEAQPVVFSRRGNRASNNNNAGGGAVPVTSVGASVPMGTGGGGGSTTVNFPTRPVRSETANVAPAPQIPIEHQYEILLKQRQAYEAVNVPLPPIPGLPSPVPTPTQ